MTRDEARQARLAEARADYLACAEAMAADATAHGVTFPVARHAYSTACPDSPRCSCGAELAHTGGITGDSETRSYGGGGEWYCPRQRAESDHPPVVPPEWVDILVEMEDSGEAHSRAHGVRLISRAVERRLAPATWWD